VTTDRRKRHRVKVIDFAIHRPPTPVPSPSATHTLTASLTHFQCPTKSSTNSPNLHRTNSPSGSHHDHFASFSAPFGRDKEGYTSSERNEKRQQQRDGVRHRERSGTPRNSRDDSKCRATKRNQKNKSRLQHTNKYKRHHYRQGHRQRGRRRGDRAFGGNAHEAPSDREGEGVTEQHRVQSSPILSSLSLIVSRLIVSCPSASLCADGPIEVGVVHKLTIWRHHVHVPIEGRTPHRALFHGA